MRELVKRLESLVESSSPYLLRIEGKYFDEKKGKMLDIVKTYAFNKKGTLMRFLKTKAGWSHMLWELGDESYSSPNGGLKRIDLNRDRERGLANPMLIQLVHAEESAILRKDKEAMRQVAEQLLRELNDLARKSRG